MGTVRAAGAVFPEGIQEIGTRSETSKHPAGTLRLSLTPYNKIAPMQWRPYRVFEVYIIPCQGVLNCILLLHG